MNQAIPQRTFTDVQKQLIKMTTVVQQIHIVLENILGSAELNKLVSESIHKQFFGALSQTIVSLNKFQRFKQTQSFNCNHLFSKISECEEEDEEPSSNTIKINSQTSDYHLFNSKLSVSNEDVGISLIITKNQELKQHNQYLTDKLKQAERYIEKIEQVNEGLLHHGWHTSHHKSQKQPSRNQQKNKEYLIKQYLIRESSTDKQKQISQLKSQIAHLKEDLQQTQDFVSRNNEEFVKQLHKKNERIWKLQKEVSDFKNQLSSSHSNTSEKQMYIQKLKGENFRLEVLSRNLKMAGTTSKHQKSYKQFQKLLKDRVATATSLDIHGAFTRK